MLNKIKNILRSQEGATAIEYGLIISLIVVAIAVSVSQVAGTTIEMWGFVSNTVVMSG